MGPTRVGERAFLQVRSNDADSSIMVFEIFWTWEIFLLSFVDLLRPGATDLALDIEDKVGFR
jgi:hypothetical protein